MMKFTKMQAFGNDYVYIDAIHQELKNLPVRIAVTTAVAHPVPQPIVSPVPRSHSRIFR